MLVQASNCFHRGNSYENLVHCSLRCRLDCSTRDHGRITTTTDEVVRHLLVKLLRRLLDDAARLSTATTTRPAAARTILTDCRLACLAIGGRLGLSGASALGLTTRPLVSRQKAHLRIDLRDAIRQLLRLRKSRHFRCTDDDFDLKHMSF